jgi:hypothetical protein
MMESEARNQIPDNKKLLATSGLAILGVDGTAMNSSKSIFLSSRARQNAVQQKNLQ